ncbi:MULTISPECIES: hypothetical protein [unclassified Actinoplanes]|uniref:hypothetical protein n=1 Tax=unclassified Actinoplanes TaxID=2626549 RepID=UPI0012BAC8B0|nr:MULTISPECIES: hypothetical protein [unclassified Actinoplanes]
MTGTGLALHATVGMSVLIGLPVTGRAKAAEEHHGAVRRRHRPGTWLLIVIGLLWLNQIAFTIYARRVHGGDLGYLGGYVPQGWFQLADGPVVSWLVAHTPQPQLLALSALRLPSLLELPLGMLAYLTIADWLDPGLYRRLTTPAVVALTSASYSITFGLIEWAMHTTYTIEDLVLRFVSGVLTAVALIRLGRRPSAPPGTGAPRTAHEFLVFAASTAALGHLILGLYDSVLLYSLGRLPAHLPGMIADVVVIAAARFAAARLRRRPVTVTGPGLDTLITGLSWWLALFLIPAMAIRYELGFGSRLFAAAAGLLVIGVATAVALREVHDRLPLSGRPAVTRRWLLGLGVAGVPASVAALIGFGLRVPGRQEIHLLTAAGLFVLTATVVSASWDRRWFTVPARH